MEPAFRRLAKRYQEQLKVRQRSVFCEACGAKPGQKCFSTNGPKIPREGIHWKRRKAATEKFREMARKEKARPVAPKAR